jgi:hypothetical protein
MTVDVRIQTQETKSEASRRPEASRSVSADANSYLRDRPTPAHGLHFVRNLKTPLLVAW